MERFTVFDLAYTGGIIDGEGHIGIKKVKSKFSQRGYLFELQVQVINTNEWLVRWLCSHFGGSVCIRKTRNEKWKDSWEWKVQTNQALKFLELLVPYIKMKKNQTLLGIQFGLNRKKGKKTKEELELDDKQRILMSKYNRKGK